MDRGVAVVEAAIILGAFFTVLFAIMEAGRFLNVQQVVTDATREGARFAVAPLSGTNSLPGIDDVPGVIGVVNQFLGSGSISLADPTDTCGAVGGALTTVEVCQDPPASCDDCTEYTHVRVITTYQPMLPLFSMLEIPVIGDIRMRNETSPL